MPPRTDFILSVDASWAAGFIDGEGSIGIRPKGHTLGVCLSVTQVDRRPLDFLSSLFGGRVGGPYGGKRGNQSAYYMWSLWSSDAARCLAAIRPYLRTKGEQADLSLEYYEYFLINKRPGVRVPPDVLSARRDFLARMKALRFGYDRAQGHVGGRLSAVTGGPDGTQK